MATPLVIGVDVGGTKIRSGVVDREGAIHTRYEAGSPGTSEEDVLRALDGAVEEVLEETIGAIGFGVPANLDRRTGRVLRATNLPFDDFDLSGHARERFGLPVGVENDANAAALAEWKLGAGRGASNLVLFTLGTGVGGGIVLDGHLYRGAHGMAGEIGHFVVQLDGVQCSCGQRGCWEKYASGSALGRIAREAGFESGEAVVAAAGAGGAKALKVLDQFTRWVAIGMAGLANTLDPAVIVIGGGLVEAGDLLLAPMRQHFNDLIEGGEHRPEVPIRPASLGERAGAIGAALIARDFLDK